MYELLVIHSSYTEPLTFRYPQVVERQNKKMPKMYLPPTYDKIFLWSGSSMACEEEEEYDT